MSIAQQTAWQRREVAAPEEVRPGLWSVALPMPGEGMPSSFGYAVIGADGVHLIDPGWPHEAALDTWTRFLADHGRSLADVATVFATHSHPDHLGLSLQLREISGARVIMSRTEDEMLRSESRRYVGDEAVQRQELASWGVPAELHDEFLRTAFPKEAPTVVEVDTLADDGDIFNWGHMRFEVIATPGHTSGHVCLLERNAEVILTGDHVLPQIFPGIGLGSIPGTDPLIDDVTSLERVAAFDNCEVLPGHEFRFRGLGERASVMAAHQLKRTRALADLVPELGDASTWEYASRLPWSRGWEGMQGFLLRSALLQTAMHRETVESGRFEEYVAGGWPTHV